MKRLSTATARKTMDDRARPIWLDMATLRYERRMARADGFGAGFMAGAVVVLVVLALLTYSGWFRG
jgi:hypothetical protein